MEQQVTEKIETKLQELPYFYNVQSYTKPGETVIYVSLRDDIPPAKVPDLWYQVRKKVGDIRGTLAAGRQRPVLQRRIRRHLQPDLGLRGRRLLAAPRSRTIVKAARQRLLRVPDVTKADLFGLQDEKIYIEFSHARLAMLGVPVDQILEVVRKQNAIVARRHGRDQGRARRGPRRRRARHGRAAGRAALQRQRPHAHAWATSPRSSAATRIRSRSRCASRASR